MLVLDIMISGNESSCPLGNHDRRHMRIRRWDVRHYQCIDDAKAGYAVDSAGSSSAAPTAVGSMPIAQVPTGWW
jgi:hypothetical protein